jgi:predicted MPP superfamily phosphohydrolase
MSTGARFAFFLSVVLGIWLAQHLYVGWRLSGLPWCASSSGRRALLGFLAVGFLTYPLGRLLWHWGWLRTGVVLEWSGAAWMGTLFLLVVALLVTEVLTLGGYAGGTWTAGVRTTLVVLALVGAAAALIGGMRPPRVVEVEARIPGLDPSLDGITLVQLSDVHLGSLLGPRFLSHVIRQVEALEPDVVVVTGDLFDSEADSVERLLPELSRLKAPRGVFAVIGNHEYYAGVDRCVHLMEAAGFHVLDNQWAEVLPGLVVAGVPDDRGARQTGHPGADLGRALDGVPAGSTVVLLQHAPEDEAAAAAAGVDLMLNGHTHGGQIWPFHVLVRREYPHLAGVFHVGDMTQVVSRGTGRWGPPMRLFAPAEVIRVTLRRRGDGA